MLCRYKRCYRRGAQPAGISAIASRFRGTHEYFADIGLSLRFHDLDAQSATTPEGLDNMLAGWTLPNAIRRPRVCHWRKTGSPRRGGHRDHKCFVAIQEPAPSYQRGVR